jgi:hypothetical protein
VKILFAAHAAVAFFTLHVISEESQRNQNKIGSRISELQYVPCPDIRKAHHRLTTIRFFSAEYIQKLISEGAITVESFTPQPTRAPYAGTPDSQNRLQVSDEERATFMANPASAVGKQSIHLPDSSEEGAYKVVGVSVTEDGVAYHVQFVECVDAVKFSSGEMEMMFSESVRVA